MNIIKRFFLEIAAPTLFVCWIAYMSYGALAGASGFQALRKLELEAAAKEQQVEALSDRRIALERRADMLNPRSLDPDMIDERIRAVLGYVDENDVVLPRTEVERMRRKSKAKTGS